MPNRPAPPVPCRAPVVPAPARGRWLVPLLVLPLVLLVPGTALAQGLPGRPAAPSATASPGPVLSAGLSTRAVAVGRAVAIAGTLTRAAPGRVVTLWRYRGGAWHGVARKALSPAGGFRFVVAPDAPGWWRYRVTAAAHRGQAAARVDLPALDVFRSYTYSIATRGSVGPEGGTFAAAVASIYADPRGWVRAHRRFTRVPTGGSFTVVLSEARYLPSFSSGCSRSYSCRVGRNVIVNLDRWRTGTPDFRWLPTYRHMVLNHETGHWLGLGHASCPRRGAPAPLMQQQSKSLQGCLANAWPLASELAGVRR